MLIEEVSGPYRSLLELQSLEISTGAAKVVAMDVPAHCVLDMEKASGQHISQGHLHICVIPEDASTVFRTDPQNHRR